MGQRVIPNPARCPVLMASLPLGMELFTLATARPTGCSSFGDNVIWTVVGDADPQPKVLQEPTFPKHQVSDLFLDASTSTRDSSIFLGGQTIEAKTETAKIPATMPNATPTGIL